MVYTTRIPVAELSVGHALVYIECHFVIIRWGALGSSPKSDCSSALFLFGFTVHSFMQTNLVVVVIHPMGGVEAEAVNLLYNGPILFLQAHQCSPNFASEIFFVKHYSVVIWVPDCVTPYLFSSLAKMTKSIPWTKNTHLLSDMGLTCHHCLVRVQASLSALKSLIQGLAAEHKQQLDIYSVY